ncbi:MAG: helix-turn-helix domain-containing protein [Eggerthellaceae bacterium]|nr:helix-turn-helix domain-containing protein [Eggerthellaceae bacterium]
MTLNNEDSHIVEEAPLTEDASDFDFTFVPTTARVALYDNLRSAPRVLEVEPAETTQYIENLTSTVYEQARAAGGTIPYTVIREVSENFIHARFREIIVSVLDAGNTIRFADQGPGIPFKEQAQKPGFSSAVEPMKKYIRGVGSGLPIVRDYLDLSHGKITIEDNLGCGSVVTISVTPYPSVPSYGSNAMAAQAGSGMVAQGQPYPAAAQPYPGGAVQGYAAAMVPQAFDAYGNPIPVQQAYPPAAMGASPWGAPAQPVDGSREAAVMAGSLIPPLGEREQRILHLLREEGAVGVSDISKILDIPLSSTHTILKKLREARLIEQAMGKKWGLTDLGAQTSLSL